MVQTKRRVYHPETLNLINIYFNADRKCGTKETIKMKFIGEFDYLWINRIKFFQVKKIN